MERSDAISRSAAIEALDQHSFENGYDYYKTVELLSELPALDLAPVVRCKDCKHHDAFDWCAEFERATVKEAFCAYGEVKGHD